MNWHDEDFKTISIGWAKQSNGFTDPIRARVCKECGAMLPPWGDEEITKHRLWHLKMEKK